MMRESIPAEELLTKTTAIGQYYGFTPLAALTARSRGAPKRAVDPASSLAALPLDPHAETVVGFLKHLRNVESAPSPRQPLFVWHTNIARGRPAPRRAIIQFHALGTDRALSDVVIIRAATALIRDLFHEQPVVRINSMGDKETRARYARELGNYFKKRSAILPEECLVCARQDIMRAAELVVERGWADDLPAPTEHLSDASRKRFEDLLEYLELTETPYELARDLLSRAPHWSDSCFELVSGGKSVAWGSRYSDLARHFFSNAPMSATGVIIQIPSTGQVVKVPPSPRLRFSFVHIGDEAKRLSIRLADEFRKARVALVQDIGIESLTEQIFLADRRNSPYLLIMGRKEALEGSAILRNRQTQVDTVVPLDGLADRLKSIA